MRFDDFRPTHRNVVQFLEYMVGGAAYFWSGYLVFAVCYSGLSWDWLPAKILADVIGWTLNYLIQRYWAFNNTGIRDHEVSTVRKYSVITVINLVIDYGIIWALKEAGVSPYVGFFISAGFFTIWNYLWYRFWVFFGKHKNTGVAHD